MSTFSNIAIGIVALALVVGGVFYAKNGTKKTPVPVPIVVEATTTPVVPTPPQDEITTRDNSNESLDQDLMSIDAKLKVVDGSSSQVDKSLNDKAVAQTE